MQNNLPRNTQYYNMDNFKTESRAHGFLSQSSRFNYPYAEINIREILPRSYRLNKASIKTSVAFAESITDCGQIEPVYVVPIFKSGESKYKLLTGKKRVNGLIANDITVVKAYICPAGDKVQNRLLCIDESLIKVELTSLQRAKLLNERKRIYEILHPTKQSEDDMNETISFPKTTEVFTKTSSEIMGLSQRVIQQDLQIANGITKENQKKIEGTFLEDKKVQLLQLARIQDSDLQSKLIDDILNHKAKNVKESLLEHADTLVSLTDIQDSVNDNSRIKNQRIKLKHAHSKIKNLKNRNRELRLENEVLKKMLSKFDNPPIKNFEELYLSEEMHIKNMPIYSEVKDA